MKKTKGYRHNEDCDCRFCFHTGQFKKGNQMRKGKSAWNKGKKAPQLTGINNGFFGKHHSKELKELISKLKKGKKLTEEHKLKISLATRGEKSHLWKGGITPIHRGIRMSREYKDWRTQVFERDNYTCQFCGKKGGDLNADHIKLFSKYPKLRFDINNGRTLCVPCHRTTFVYVGNQYNKLKIIV